MMPELTSWPAVLRRHIAERRSEPVVYPDEKLPSASPETISARRGRPRKGEAGGTITVREPWRAEGVSRRTWYRRRGRG
jgi:hypothetical protein